MRSLLDRTISRFVDWLCDSDDAAVTLIILVWIAGILVAAGVAPLYG